MWSLGLFVATFYSIIGKDSAFDFNGKLLLDVASTHIFPMIMAMTLYLLDVIYNALLVKINYSIVIWILGTIIVFLGGFVASLMINNNFWGWFFFCIAWLSLTVLKFVTTEAEGAAPHIVTED